METISESIAVVKLILNNVTIHFKFRIGSYSTLCFVDYTFYAMLQFYHINGESFYSCMLMKFQC
jgi:hypothetical protein